MLKALQITAGLFSYLDQVDRLSHVKVIALTGGIGSGKSLVANYFFSLGAEVIDADQLARQAIERGSDGFDQVVATFGDGILKDGDIDRRALGEIVFSDPEKRKALEAIVHPIVQQGLAEARKNLSEDEILIYEIPLLVETKAMEKFDAIITVEAPLEERINRLTKRGLMRSEIERRIANQVSPEERKAVASFVIENDGDEEQLLRKVEAIWEELNASRN
jgi:dephospho-CoA kinase